MNIYQWTWSTYTHLDTGRNKGGELPLLEVVNGALLSSGLALARCCGFLERVGPRGLGAGVTEIARGRIRSDRVFRLQLNVSKKVGKQQPKCAP